MQNAIAQQFETQGFISPLNVVTPEVAAVHRQTMEQVEGELGPLHYQNKIHTIMQSPYALLSHPTLLDAVEQIIGPNILLYNATYIVKEPHSPSHVSWHQDLTYWGLDSDRQVSAWLALSTADETSGCMRMIPGSHRAGQKHHELAEDDQHNVLFQSQTVRDIDESLAVSCPLAPGQASLHHGWTLHASAPNHADDRRIGLNIQYISPEVRQLKQPGYSALLLRGEDRFGHYAAEFPAQQQLDRAAIPVRQQMEDLYREITATA